LQPIRRPKVYNENAAIAPKYRNTAEVLDGKPDRQQHPSYRKLSRYRKYLVKEKAAQECLSGCAYCLENCLLTTSPTEQAQHSKGRETRVVSVQRIDQICFDFISEIPLE
jgi:hypothetical protein